ncbi:MAG: TonB-dependent receptor [Rhodospirillales bacterium]
MKPRSYRYWLASATMLSTASLMGVQDVAAQNIAIEEIIVTARNREESLQNVPLSVTVFSSEMIERAGIARIDDIARLTPSLVFEQNFSAQDTRPIIRGLPASRGRPPIGVLIDGVDVSSEAVATAGGGNLLNLRLIDVDRIEVVKGPQSALYGRVAFGGAINYVTKRPGDEVSGSLNATAASHGTYEVVGAVEGPVVDEAMNIRLHAGYSRSDGYHENTVSDKNIGGYESAQASLTTALRLTENFTVDASVTYSKTDSEQQPYVAIGIANGTSVPLALPSNVAGKLTGNLRLPGSILAPPLGELRPNQTVNVSLNPRTLEDYPGSSLDTFFSRVHAEYDLGGAVIESTTGYLRAKSSVFQDIDGVGRKPVQVMFPLPGGIGEPLPSTFEFSTEGVTKQFSEDIKIGNINSDDKFRWLVGGLYWDEKSNQDNRSFAVLLINPTSSAGLNNVLAGNPRNTSTGESRETSHYSVYGLVEYDVSSSLTVGLEARQYWEDFVYGFPTSQIGFGLGLTPVATNPGAPGPKGLPLSQKYFAPKGYIEYQASEDVMVYGSIGKGVKPGGISTVGRFNRLEDNVFSAEQLWNYEIGAKTTWLDGRAIFNSALFYMDYTDKQVSTLVVDPTVATGFRSVIANAGAARVYGAEIDSRFALSEQFDFAFAYTFLDAKYTDFTIFTRSASNVAFSGECEVVEVGSGRSSTQCLLDLSGNNLERAPKHALSATLTYTQPITDSLELLAEASLQYQSKRYFTEYNGQWFGGFSNVDVRLGLQSEFWSITGYVDNLFDNKTIKSGFGQGDFFGFFTNRGSRAAVLNKADPIRGGIRASYRF